MDSKSSNEIKIIPLSMVDQGLIGFEMDLMGDVSRQVASLQDQVVRQQLEKAGWLSPEAAAALRAQVEALTKPQEPVMVYHGGCTVDCGEHGHHNMEMLKLIPAGTKLYAHPATAPLTRSVYLVATGEVHEGQETYTRHDAPVPMADQEVLFTRPPEPLTRPAVPEGWKLVPVEITEGMVRAWQQKFNKQLSRRMSSSGRKKAHAGHLESCEAVAYRAMLAAAPQSKVQAEPVSIELDFKQATELLEMFGGEPGLVTLIPGDGHSGQGLYACWTDVPGEGTIYLGNSDDEARPEARPEAQPADPHANCPPPVDEIEAAEREHMGCAHCKTGIYAKSQPTEAAQKGGAQ